MSDDQNLRPIGIEFDIEAIPDIYSTDGMFWKVFTYRVKAHVSVARFEGDKEGKTAEEITPISVKLFHPIREHHPGNQILWKKGGPVALE